MLSFRDQKATAADVCRQLSADYALEGSLRRAGSPCFKKAWEAGYRDAVWTRGDPDLASLHGDPEFEKLYPAPAQGRARTAGRDQNMKVRSLGG